MMVTARTGNYNREAMTNHENASTNDGIAEKFVSVNHDIVSRSKPCLGITEFRRNQWHR